MTLLLYFITISPSPTPVPAGSTETIHQYTMHSVGTRNDKTLALPGKTFYEIIKSQPQKAIAPLKQNYQDKIFFNIQKL
jgi:hypothetical protein